MVRVNRGELQKAGRLSLIPGCNGVDTTMRVRVRLSALCYGPLYRTVRGFIHGCKFMRYPQDGGHTQAVQLSPLEDKGASFVNRPLPEINSLRLNNDYSD